MTNWYVHNPSPSLNPTNPSSDIRALQTDVALAKVLSNSIVEVGSEVGWRQTMNTHYINTDLELFASFDLTELATVLEAQELFPLHVTQQEDGCWMAGFEFVTFEGGEKYADPESTIIGMLDIVEALEGEARTLWNTCSLRNFNIGYTCGEEPFDFHHRISNATLLRIANVGAAMEITLYGMRGQQDDVQEGSGETCSS